MADPKEDELRNVALNLVTMLRTALNSAASNIQGQNTAQARSASSTQQDTSQKPSGQIYVPAHAQRPSETAVQRNMARCFPGLFKDTQNSRPLSRLSKKRPGIKITPIQFYLLHSSSEKTPKPSEELMLLHAGLGRRTVNIPNDASHKEISNILCETYPKMSDLEGSWMLHKAMVGSGQRKLNLLSPEAEGYTGASLVKSWGGKGCLYIMPIQHTLDITPLPFTAPEFQAMPKARCVSCQDYVPLQLLGLHVNTCTKSAGTDEANSNSDIVNLDDMDFDDMDDEKQNSVTLPVSTDKQQPSDLKNKVCCPLCSQLFTKDDIFVHASFCGESHTKDAHVTDCEDTKEHYNSVSDILMSLQKKIDTSTTFHISVTKQDLFQRGMKQWSRQKKASPRNLLRVSFIGEHGIDQGALGKEFLTEMVRGIENQFFEGNGERGKNPKYSMLDYQDCNFKTCGEILATSLVQGGPAPNFLTRWCYHFLCQGEIHSVGGPDDVTAPDITRLIKKVENAEEEVLIELSDAIVSCGYTGPINIDRKEAITNAVALHAKVRLIPMLNQLREGLRLYGLDELLQHHQQMCQQLFVPGHLNEVDSNFLLRALYPDFSEEGSVRRQREMKVINFLQDFVQNLEDIEADSKEDDEIKPGSPGSHVAAVPRTTDGGKCVSLRSFFQWVTGQAHIPLIEAEREAFKIMVSFDHDCDSLWGT